MVKTNGEDFIDERIDLDENYFGIVPGLGLNDKTSSEIIRLINRNTEPMVIDADALNILSNNKNEWDKIPMNSILTPHPKELARWIGNWNNDFEKLERTAKLAKKHSLFIIIKGAYTVTVSPKQQFYFNSSGNPGLATAGSGDVLKGIITGLLAQGYSALESCILGVYLHGLSGDIAIKNSSEESLIASDIIENLGKAYLQIKNQ